MIVTPDGEEVEAGPILLEDFQATTHGSRPEVGV